MPTPFSRWTVAAIGAALLAAGATWGIAGDRIFAPAALSGAAGAPLGGVRSHAELAGDCGACHVAPWRRETMEQRCIGCHTDVRSELRDTTTLHGALGDATRCRACHTEHGGEAGVLTRFAVAALEHATFGFSLASHGTTARGAPFACTDCHAPGNFRFDGARCAGCHREHERAFVDEHVAAWGSDCRACHDGSGAVGAGFAHAKFALTGAHLRVDCQGCHQGARTAAMLAATPTACIGCHRADDEHQGSMGSDCAACHGTATWEGASFDHTFPLTHESRTPIECRVCHQDAPRDFVRYTCYGCHEHSPADIRQEHTEEGISAADVADCMRCHPTGREHDGRERDAGREDTRRRGNRRH